MNKKNKRSFIHQYTGRMEGLRDVKTFSSFVLESLEDRDYKDGRPVCLNCLRLCKANPFKPWMENKNSKYYYFSDCCMDKVGLIFEEMKESEKLKDFSQLINKDFLMDMAMLHLHDDFDSRGDYYINEMEKIRDILSGFSSYIWEDKKEIENQIEKMDRLRTKVRRERVLLAFREGNKLKNGEDGK